MFSARARPAGLDRAVERVKGRGEGGKESETVINTAVELVVSDQVILH